MEIAHPLIWMFNVRPLALAWQALHRSGANLANKAPKSIFLQNAGRGYFIRYMII
jgi:hypothetical protein